MTSGRKETTDGDERDRQLAAMRDLTVAMSAGDDTVERRIERVLDVGREHLGFPTAYMAVVDGTFHTVSVSTGVGATELTGTRSPLEETYCRRAIETDGVYAVCNASETMESTPAYERFGTESYLGIELRVDGETYGTLCFGDQEDPRESLSAWQETLLEHLREWVESELEREKARERSERSQRLLEATFNSPETFIGVLSPDGEILMSNETALSFIDGDREALRGRPFHETPWWDHDEDVQRQCRAAVEQAAAGETVQFEAEHVSPDGQRITTAVTIRPVWQDGEVSEIIAEGTDITSQKTREEQVEFFNSILRHDILNGMNVIRARAELLDAELEGEQREYVGTILDWSDDIIDLTKKVRSVLSTLSESSLSECEPIELRPLVEDAADRARSMDDDCTVDIDVPDVEVAGDDLLDDVFGNLFTNAVEHAGPGVAITVSAVVEGDRVRVSIADDGPGIEPADRRSVFERGEKGVDSSGTGFGLYFVEAMVESYGGDVWITDSEQGGAAFVVELRTA